MDRHFLELLNGRWDRDFFGCVGLDSNTDRIPESVKREAGGDLEETVYRFNCKIIEATHGRVCAFKPQAAYYEDDAAKMRALRRTVEHIHMVAPHVPIIYDAKRADIASTNEGYVRAILDKTGLDMDAVTLHPYLGGREALAPFLKRSEKGCIILCRTSNPDAAEFQDLVVKSEYGEMPLYQAVAHRVAHRWNANGNALLVVGATYPEEGRLVRDIVEQHSEGEMPFLIPGAGEQRGDIQKMVRADRSKRGRGMIINNSRAIIFASKEPDFAEVASRKLDEMHEEIERYRLVA